MKEITEKAILVRIAIGMPGSGKQDKEITDEVIEDKDMKAKAGKWVKNLYPPDAFKPLGQVANKARIFHYENSLPWGDNGDRILPVANHMDYMDGLRKLKTEFDSMAHAHVDANFAKWVQWAQDTHGPKFNAADYPGASEVKKKFRFKIEVNPVPIGDDFRVALGDEELTEMREQLETRVSEAVEGARKDLWNRLVKPIQHMATTLKESNAKFRNSLVENVKEIVSLIPVLNLTGDKDLAAFADEIGKTLARKNPETLRENATSRAETAKQADALVKRMQGYF